MHLIPLLFTLLTAAATVVAVFHHNATTGDGVYTHYVDENGVEHTLYVGPLAPRGGAIRSVRREDFGVQCQSDVTVNGDDAGAAADSLGSVFGDGFTWFKSISAKSGSAVVYGCDYGHGQTMNSAQLLQYMSDIATECGEDAAGFFRDTNSKTSYGRTNVGIGFC